jgi:uncharacterized repeat protein (TIGR01451 family)
MVLGLICLGFVGVNSSGAAAAFIVSIGKAFGAPSVAVGATTSLTFTIDNSGATAATGVDFTDPLPSGLQFSTGAGITDHCDTGLPGQSDVFTTSTLLTVTNDAVGGNAMCTIVVTVIGVSPGLQVNTTSALQSSVDNGSIGVATIDVEAPPVVTKTFGASTIPLNGVTSLTFHVVNPPANVITLTGVGFTDTLPTGLVVDTPNGMTGACAGTIADTAGSGSISLSGATFAANGSCIFSVNVKGVAVGVQNNTTSTVTSDDGGTGGAASATVTVLGPPTITKAFGAASIATGADTLMTLTVTNPNTTVALTGLAFSDNLPTGLTIPGSVTNGCLGTVTVTSTSVSVAGGSVPAGSSCTVSGDVTSSTIGNYTNTTSTVTSANAPPSGTASATLNVGGGAGGGAALPPVITKAFGATSLQLGARTTMTFNLSNPAVNTISLSGIGFTDPLPAGLVVSTPNGESTTCGGTLTDTEATTAVILTGVTLAPGASCTVTVDVDGIAPGTQTNTTGAVTSVEAGPGNTATAVITVDAPPTISKSFSPDSIEIGSTSTLTFTITNPAANVVTLTGIGFSDSLPAGLRVAAPNHESDDCGGSVSAAGGSTSVSLTGGSLGVDDSCTISVDMAALTAGTKNNVTSQVTSVQGGPGNSASASLVVTEGEGGGGCNSATGSATSDTPGGSAAAVNDGTTATGNNGEGTVTVRGYEGDPVGPPSGFSPGCFFDVSLSPGSTFSSLTIQDCSTGGLNGLEWWNPAGGGAWLPVTGDPGPTLSSGEPTCLNVTLDSTTSPNLGQLGGTVFATTGGSSSPPGTRPNGAYDLVGSDGGVFVFGDPAGFFGSLPGLHISVNNIVGIVPTIDSRGYFLVGSDGGVFAFGDAPFEGSLPKLGIHVSDIVGIVPTRDDRGYFLVGRDGGVFSLGDAPFENSLPGQGIHVNNIVGIAATVDDAGYWLVSSAGSVYALGDARNLGATTAGSIVSLSAMQDGGGYWLASAAGGIFNYGDAGFFNSLPGLGIKVSNIVSLVPSSDGEGYLLIGRDGGVFAFGDAVFPGSLPGIGVHVNNVVGAVPTG